MAKTLTTELLALTHAQLEPAPDNLRGTLTDVSDLADSIAAAGLLQPIRVRAHPSKKNRWEIIAGHRRHAAFGLLIEAGRWSKTQPIACVIDVADVDDQARVQAMLVENLQRQDLDPIEEARGFHRLTSEFGHPVRDVAGMVGVSKSVVSARTQLLKLPETVQAKVSSGDVPLDVAALLCQLPAAKAEQLVKAGAHRNKWAVEDAIRTEKKRVWRDSATKAIAAAGMTVSKAANWQLEPTHTPLARNMKVAELGKLLVDDRTVCEVTLDDHNQLVSVWARRPAPSSSPAQTSGGGGLDVDADTGDVDKDPLNVTIAQFEQLRTRIRQHREEALRAWWAQRGEIEADLARTASAKDVAAAAMWRIAFDDADDGWEAAAAAGFDDSLDADQAAWLAWLVDPKHLVATVAHSLLAKARAGEFEFGDNAPTDLLQRWRERMDALGPQPAQLGRFVPELASSPTTPADALALWQLVDAAHPDRAAMIARLEAAIVDEAGHADEVDPDDPDAYTDADDLEEVDG